MSETPASTPAGWFPDPLGRHEHRWFNGTAWTSDVADNGQRFVDPLGIAPGGAPHASGSGSGNGVATAAMTCGIIALLLAWIPFVVIAGIVLAVLALVFGVKGLRRSAAAGRGRGFAITGLVTGGGALLASIVGIALSVVVWNAAIDFIEPGRLDNEVTDCRIDGRTVTVGGLLTNESRSVRSYTVFVSIGGRTDYAEIDDVSAGESVPWEIGVRTRTIAEVCDPQVTVNGPLPFGLEMDPVDG